MSLISTEPLEDFVIEAELVDVKLVKANYVGRGSVGKSWPARAYQRSLGLVKAGFGLASLLLLLAIVVCIPIVQVVAFGYLLEVSGRTASGKPIRSVLPGLDKAAVLGGILLGGLLCLIPLQLASGFWYDAFLIDPGSRQTFGLRLLQIALLVLTIGHVSTVLLCGGRLRHFFWPIVAPFQLAIWLVRKCLGGPGFNRLLNISLGWIDRRLPADIQAAPPLSDWFVPSILVRRMMDGGMYVKTRDRLWDFFVGLRLRYNFWLGLKGLLGSCVWLAAPTSMLVGSAFVKQDVLAGLLFFAGVVTAVPVFASMVFVQTHFSVDGRIRRFWQLRSVFDVFGRAPIAHWIALVGVLLLAVPPFLLKIEVVPTELTWALALVFVILAVPARLLAGWAYRRGTLRALEDQRDGRSYWWIRYPAMLATGPISLVFVLLFFVARYVSWHGSLSMIENHAFLLPTPFWI